MPSYPILRFLLHFVLQDGDSLSRLVSRCDLHEFAIRADFETEDLHNHGGRDACCAKNAVSRIYFEKLQNDRLRRSF